MILAGGRGDRLFPLTKERAKPAVPFGGKYRIIDFVLSNLTNSGFFRIKVLTQFKSDSLIRHLSRGWSLGPVLDQYVDPVPAQMRLGDMWYRGTADAIFQNQHILEAEHPHHVAVFGGDHVYKMNVQEVLLFHMRKRAAVTICSCPFLREKASSFGVIEVDRSSRVIGFEEKPPEPKGIPGREDYSLASMGNYIFNADVLVRALKADAEDENSTHDFGRDIMPWIYKEYPVYAYDFSLNHVPGEPHKDEPYWRDVGTIDSYYDSNMDLRSVSPVFNLYNRQWPIKTVNEPCPPAKFVFAEREEGRYGQAIDSIVSEGCVMSGSTVLNSVLSRNVFVHSYSDVRDSILMDGCDIGRWARIRRAILDKGVRVGEHATIGYDTDEDARRFTVSDEGIVVIEKGTVVEE